MFTVRKMITLTLSALVALSLAACSTSFKPAPIGDELVWSSEKDRPAWTVKSPEVDQGADYVFTGQSLYHATERSAKMNAEVDASTAAARYLSRQSTQNYAEVTEGIAKEGDIQNGDVAVSNSQTLAADQFLTKMSVQDWYLEQWRKGNQTFWKAYVKTAMPKNRI